MKPLLCEFIANDKVRFPRKRGMLVFADGCSLTVWKDFFSVCMAWSQDEGVGGILAYYANPRLCLGFG